MIKNSEEDIWTWYQHIEKWRASGLPRKKFAEAEGISYNKLSNMIFRIVYKTNSDPKLYQTLVKHGRAYLASGIKLSSKYAKEHNIRVSYLSQIITHLNYLDIIEKMKKKWESTMNFIEVPRIPISNGGRPIAVAPEAEVIEKQNDLEIIIAKGVKSIYFPQY